MVSTVDLCAHANSRGKSSLSKFLYINITIPKSLIISDSHFFFRLHTRELVPTSHHAQDKPFNYSITPFSLLPFYLIFRLEVMPFILYFYILFRIVRSRITPSHFLSVYVLIKDIQHSNQLTILTVIYVEY